MSCVVRKRPTYQPTTNQSVSHTNRPTKRSSQHYVTNCKRSMMVHIIYFIFVNRVVGNDINNQACGESSYRQSNVRRFASGGLSAVLCLGHGHVLSYTTSTVLSLYSTQQSGVLCSQIQAVHSDGHTRVDLIVIITSVETGIVGLRF